VWVAVGNEESGGGWLERKHRKGVGQGCGLPRAAVLGAWARARAEPGKERAPEGMDLIGNWHREARAVVRKNSPSETLSHFS